MSASIQDTLESLYFQRKQKTFNLYLFVLCLLVLIAVSLPYVHVDISTQQRGIVKSLYENTTVVSLISGRVIENKILHNNQSIHKGDTLLKIEAKAVDESVEVNLYEKSHLESQISDINRLKQGTVPNSALYQDEKKVYEQHLKEANINLQQTQSIENNLRMSFSKGYTSKQDYEKAKKDVMLAEANIRQIKAEYLKNLEAKKDELLLRVKSKELEINQQKNQEPNYTIIANETGTVVNYKPLSIGGFVLANSPICELAFNHSQLVEVYVSPSEIGYINKGQKVKFQIDAYNYNQWGLASGEVIDIDKNITHSQEGNYAFKVRCRLNNSALKLKNGYEGKIIKGMTLTARFIVTRRSLWQILFDKLDDWLNPHIIKIERKEKADR